MWQCIAHRWRPSRSMWCLIRWTRYACSSRTKFVASIEGFVRDLPVGSRWIQTNFMKRRCISLVPRDINMISDIMRSWDDIEIRHWNQSQFSMSQYGRGLRHARRKISELWVMKLMERWRERMSLLRPISFVRFDVPYVQCSMFAVLTLQQAIKSIGLVPLEAETRTFEIRRPISSDQCTFHDSFLACLQYWLHLMSFWCPFPPWSLTFSWFCHVFFMHLKSISIINPDHSSHLWKRWILAIVMVRLGKCFGADRVGTGSNLVPCENKVMIWPFCPVAHAGERRGEYHQRTNGFARGAAAGDFATSLQNSTFPVVVASGLPGCGGEARCAKETTCEALRVSQCAFFSSLFPLARKSFRSEAANEARSKTSIVASKCLDCQSFPQVQNRKQKLQN